MPESDIVLPDDHAASVEGLFRIIPNEQWARIEDFVGPPAPAAKSVLELRFHLSSGEANDLTTYLANYLLGHSLIAINLLPNSHMDGIIVKSYAKGFKNEGLKLAFDIPYMNSNDGDFSFTIDPSFAEKLLDAKAAGERIVAQRNLRSIRTGVPDFSARERRIIGKALHDIQNRCRCDSELGNTVDQQTIESTMRNIARALWDILTERKILPIQKSHLTMGAFSQNSKVGLFRITESFYRELCDIFSKPYNDEAMMASAIEPFVDALGKIFSAEVARYMIDGPAPQGLSR